MTALESRVRDVLDEAADVAQAAGATDGVSAMRRLRQRLDEPMRVAIAGRVKAGKSTLLNALVGERLAATDAGECTRFVTWYVYDEEYTVEAAGRDRPARRIPFVRDGDRLVIDEREIDARDTHHLTVGWPSSRLRTMTLIDTPGTASLSHEVGERAEQALHADEEGASPADAVVYLMRHAHQSDLTFLREFLDDQLGPPTPVNSVAVLSRADEIGAGRLDAMQSAAAIAARYAADGRVRAVASAVVPVAGLLAETAVTLREREADALRTVAREPGETVRRMLLSVDHWREPGAGPLTTEIRQDLLDRFGLFGLRFAVHAFRDERWTSGGELARMLLAESGLPVLERVVRQRFAGRARQLVARSVLLGLRSVVMRMPGGWDDGRLIRRVEETESSSHELAELRMLELVWSGEVPFSGDERDEAERVTGATSLAEKAGREAGASHEAVRTAAIDGATRWRARAGDGRSDPLTVMCCETMARSYEGVYLAAAK